MTERQIVKEKIRPIKKLIEDDEYRLLLSELKEKAKVDTKGEQPYLILSDNFGGSF